MTRRSIALTTVRSAAAVVALVVLFLFVDYAVATAHKPKDDARVAELEEKAQTSASFARDLADEQNRITLARGARKARLRWLSLVLIAASVTFIGGAKWFLEVDGYRAGIMTKPARVAPEPTPAIPARITQPQSPAPSVDLSFVDQVVAKEGTGKEAAIPILQAIQEHYRYLPDEALQRVCELTQVTPAQIAGTSTFYGRFRRSPVGKHIIRVCHGTACHVCGARQITEELRRHLQIPEGASTDPQRMFTVEEVACLGCCSLAPVLMLDDQTAGKLTPSSACASLEGATQTEPA
jgi:NADH:ubiquinone oxidoreductase subunit E